MASYIIHGRNLTLSGDPSACTYAVEIAGSVWQMSERPYVRFSDGTALPFPEPESEGICKTGTTEGIAAVYSDFGSHRLIIRTKAEIEVLTDDVYFTLQAEGDSRCEIAHISFPAPFDFGTAYGDKPDLTDDNLPESYTVLSRMQGTLVPAGTQIRLAGGQVFERDGYMPIFGQVRKNTGYLAIYDTPYDVKYELRYQNGGEKAAPLWIPSLGFMAYPRKMLYRFMENCSYNDFASSYRTYVRQRGRLVTLREKIARNPKVEKLPGCPVIHCGIATHVSPESDYYRPDDPDFNDSCVPFHTRAEQIRQLHRKGVRKAYTHFDGWGNHGYDNLHPDPFPPHEAAGGAEGMRELADTTTGCGFIFGIHDQYRDYYYDAPSFSFDSAITNPDGSHPFCSIWYGGKHSWLCSSVARDYVRRNYAVFEALGIGVEAAYLDVFSVVSLDECFNPAHPATREQCAAYRRECLDHLTSRGIIPSSEEVLDCILPSQILCHHAPYFTSNLGANDAEAVGIPIPLLNLVYHDCVVVPWIGRKNQRGGWGIPASDSAYAHAWLNGGPLYLSITADDAEIAEVTEVCENAEKLALQPMLRHEFLTPDRRIQRTVFADGTTVTVNFDTDEVQVQ
ncbi:MAG: DUF5696 domain-containing protein [Oscillospiraceae bacterium]|nr:DUF5696 domain-containing protein [Oscillospiraceae bacterium]